jgi:hypothetical protein
MIKKGKMKKEIKKEEEEETMIYMNNKTGTRICMSLEYGVLTKEQTAYMDSSCGMGS